MNRFSEKMGIIQRNQDAARTIDPYFLEHERDFGGQKLPGGVSFLLHKYLVKKTQKNIALGKKLWYNYNIKMILAK